MVQADLVPRAADPVAVYRHHARSRAGEAEGNVGNPRRVFVPQKEGRGRGVVDAGGTAEQGPRFERLKAHPAVMPGRAEAGKEAAKPRRDDERPLHAPEEYAT